MSSIGASTTSSSTPYSSGPTHARLSRLVSAMRSGPGHGRGTRSANGVADDKLIYSYVPDLIRYYLDEDPILPNVDTYRCIEPTALRYVLNHVDEMVVKPVAGSGGKGPGGGEPKPPRPSSTRSVRRSSPTRATGSHSRSSSCRRSRRSSTASSGRATSTCGRSRSTTASGSRSSRAASRASPSPRGSWSSTRPVVAARRTPGCSPTRAHSRPVTQERPREVIVASPPAVFRDDEIRAQQQQQQQSGADGC